MDKTKISLLFYPEDKNLEHFYKVVNKLRDERLIRSSEKKEAKA